MNSKRGFKRITFTLAAVAALASGIFAGMVPCTEYQTARSLWGLDDPIIVKEPSEQELQQFNAWKKKMGISTTVKFSRDTMRLDELENTLSCFGGSLPTLMEARNTLQQNERAKWWNGLSKSKLFGLVVLYSLGGLVVGFLGVWLILWFSGLAICKLIKWLILGFYNDESSKQMESMEAG